MKKLLRSLVFSGILLAAWATPSLAQQDSDGWAIRFSPYLWGTSIEGTSAIAVLPTLDVDASLSDILDNLNFVLALHTEFEKGRWTFVIDPFVAKLEMDVNNAFPPVTGVIDIDMWIVEAWAGYEFVPDWELLGGVRWQSQEIAPSLSLGLPFSGIDVDWTDVFIGGRVTKDIGERWFLTARVDVVAFGSDSDDSWNVTAFFNRRIGRNMALNLGYRYYTVDYQEGSGLSQYAWDVDMTGPVVGYTWEF